jgi:hypothetical protein
VLEVKEYKVETEHIIRKYAAITVEAKNEREALEKARASAKEDFLESETAETSQWQIKKEKGSFFDFLSFLTGK